MDENAKPPTALPDQVDSNTQRDQEVSLSPEQTISYIENTYRKYLTPEKVRSKIYPISWILMALLVGVIILYKLWPLNSASPLSALWWSKNKKTIDLLLTKEQNLIAVIKSEGKGEIRLINPLTGKAQDISLGDVQVTQATLSPNGETVAYISTQESGSKLFLYSLVQPSPSPSPSPSLLSLATPSLSSSPQPSPSPPLDPVVMVFSSSDFKVCEWSSVNWSPKTNQLAFFGCKDNRSEIYLVPAQKDGKPAPLKNTECASKEKRDLLWLENGDLIFTGGKQQVDAIKRLNNPVSDREQEPKRLYGDLN